MMKNGYRFLFCFLTVLSAGTQTVWADNMIVSHVETTKTIGEAASVADSIGLQDVVVTGTRSATDARYLPMTVTVISRDMLTEQQRSSIMPTLSEQVPSLFVTSRAMMGYGVSSGSAGGINLRGISGGSGGMLVLIDGHPQYSNIYGHPISDSYQTLMAERVEVVRGPASVLYGSNAMGGVLNIVTRSVKEDGSHTSFNLGAGSYGTVQAQVSNQSRHGAFSSTVGVQYNRSDNHRPRMDFEQESGYVKLGYDITPHWHTYAEANLTRFEGSDPGSTTQPIYDRDQWITRGEATIAVENHYDRTNGTVSIFANFGNHRIDDGWSVGRANGNGPDQRDYYFRSKDNLTGVSLYQSFILFDGNLLTAGFDYQHHYGHAYNTSKLTGEITNAGKPTYSKSHRNEVAGYVDFRQNITEWLTVDAGLRMDHHSVSGTEWVPQAGIAVRPTDNGQLKAMVGKGFRNPTMKDLYLYAMANDSLKPERIWNYELSWRQHLGPLTYGANLYYLKGDNMIQAIPVNGKLHNVNTGEVENYGLELEADWRLNNHLTLTTNHSLLHMKNPVVGAPRYKGYAGARWHCCHWSIVAGLQYLNSLYTAVGQNEEKENVVLLGATIGYQVTKDVGFWLRSENLLAQKYEINLGFPMPRATFMAGISLNF